MENNKLRKLSRKSLLEILLEQTKRIEQLEIELEKTKEELTSKKVSLKEVGSLAEASLKLSNIFKSADEAVQIYLNNVKGMIKEENKND